VGLGIRQKIWTKVREKLDPATNPFLKREQINWGQGIQMNNEKRGRKEYAARASANSSKRVGGKSNEGLRARQEGNTPFFFRGGGAKRRY